MSLQITKDPQYVVVETREGTEIARTQSTINKGHRVNNWSSPIMTSFCRLWNLRVYIIGQQPGTNMQEKHPSISPKTNNCHLLFWIIMSLAENPKIICWNTLNTSTTENQLTSNKKNSTKFPSGSSQIMKKRWMLLAPIIFTPFPVST